MRTPARLLIAVMAVFSMAVSAHAQQGGDDNVTEAVAAPATGAAADAARRAIGVSGAVATGVGVFLTPSTPAGPAQSECNGTANCNQGFPSTPPPPPALPPAPPAPVGYVPPPPPSEPQFVNPDE